MRRRRDEEDEFEEEEDYRWGRGGGLSESKKRVRSSDIIEDEEYGGGKKRKPQKNIFVDDEALLNSDDEEFEDIDGEDDFIDPGTDLAGEDDDGRRHHRPMLPREDDHEDFEAPHRILRERYPNSSLIGYNEERTQVDQQALLPSVRDPKLWMVKCVIGRERETAVCLLQKYIDKGSPLQIRSVIALDHLKNYIY